ncbi:hypothetical protein V5R04_01310 [Jonesiaceae bacterium BS-20]|uniref:Uncharacterized protein n=1 Tax=Jonesiaceae bacterium BS-20 TaxID=3120821 RepID=A0AAU7DX21_9MICO
MLGRRAQAKAAKPFEHKVLLLLNPIFVILAVLLTINMVHSQGREIIAYTGDTYTQGYTNGFDDGPTQGTSHTGNQEHRERMT